MRSIQHEGAVMIGKTQIKDQGELFGPAPDKERAARTSSPYLSKKPFLHAVFVGEGEWTINWCGRRIGLIKGCGEGVRWESENCTSPTSGEPLRSSKVLCDVDQALNEFAENIPGYPHEFKVIHSSQEPPDLTKIAESLRAVRGLMRGTEREA